MAQARRDCRIVALFTDWRCGVLICFIVIDKLTPYKLWDEIIQKQNAALAIVVAAMCLGIAIIVAAAIH